MSNGDDILVAKSQIYDVNKICQDSHSFIHLAAQGRDEASKKHKNPSQCNTN